MSSLKNLVKTRTYRERAQPKARAKLGMLEKHKDYVKRARDFHQKEDAINKMKEKASFKNQDEFYFKMINSKLQVRPRTPASGAAAPTPRACIGRTACTARRPRRLRQRTSWPPSRGKTSAT